MNTPPYTTCGFEVDMHLRPTNVVSQRYRFSVQVYRNANIGRADLHDKPDQNQTKKSDNKGASLSKLVGCMRNNNGKYRSRNINRNRHELGCTRRVAEGADDSWQKKADAIERASNLYCVVSILMSHIKRERKKGEGGVEKECHLLPRTLKCWSKPASLQMRPSHISI